MSRGAQTLAEALAAEQAAIYAYGVAGVHLDEDRVEAARAAELQHRRRRDELVVLLGEREVEAPAVAAAYELPFEVEGAESGLQLAVVVEERVAAVWRASLFYLAGQDRELALSALIGAAVQATEWRAAAGVAPATVPFPGESEPGD